MQTWPSFPSDKLSKPRESHLYVYQSYIVIVRKCSFLCTEYARSCQLFFFDILTWMYHFLSKKVNDNLIFTKPNSLKILAWRMKEKPNNCGCLKIKLCLPLLSISLFDYAKKIQHVCMLRLCLGTWPSQKTLRKLLEIYSVELDI